MHPFIERSFTAKRKDTGDFAVIHITNTPMWGYVHKEIALFGDGFFAERHANILNWCAPDILGYTLNETADGKYAVVTSGDITTDEVAVFNDYKPARDYVIQMNTDLMFKAYEAERQANTP